MWNRTVSHKVFKKTDTILGDQQSGDCWNLRIENFLSHRLQNKLSGNLWKVFSFFFLYTEFEFAHFCVYIHGLFLLDWNLFFFIKTSRWNWYIEFLIKSAVLWFFFLWFLKEDYNRIFLVMKLDFWYWNLRDLWFVY